MNHPKIHLPPGSFTLMEVAELKKHFHPRNDKEHPPSQIALYTEVLKELGIRGAVILSARSGLIVKGHGAILTCEANGWTHYPVQEQPFETEEMELAFLVADNALPGLAKRIDSRTAAILARLKDKLNLSATGMKPAVIGRLLVRAQMSSVPVPRPKAPAGRLTCPECGHCWDTSKSLPGPVAKRPARAKRSDAKSGKPGK